MESKDPLTLPNILEKFWIPFIMLCKSLHLDSSELHLTDSSELLNASYRIDTLWHPHERWRRIIAAVVYEELADGEDQLPEGLSPELEQLPGEHLRGSALPVDQEMEDPENPQPGKALPLERPASWNSWLEELIAASDM